MVFIKLEAFLISLNITLSSKTIGTSFLKEFTNDSKNGELFPKMYRLRWVALAKVTAAKAFSKPYRQTNHQGQNYYPSWQVAQAQRRKLQKPQRRRAQKSTAPTPDARRDAIGSAAPRRPVSRPTTRPIDRKST